MLKIIKLLISGNIFFVSFEKDATFALRFEPLDAFSSSKKHKVLHQLS